MRLVENGVLKLDEDVNDTLTSWKVPGNSFDASHKVTLRGLLSMTGGIGVPGFIGYEIGAALPTLTQILDGAPPAYSAAMYKDGLEDIRDRMFMGAANFALFMVPGTEHVWLDNDPTTVVVDEVDLETWLTQAISGDAAWASHPPAQ